MLGRVKSMGGRDLAVHVFGSMAARSRGAVAKRSRKRQRSEGEENSGRTLKGSEAQESSGSVAAATPGPTPDSSAEEGLEAATVTRFGGWTPKQSLLCGWWTAGKRREGKGRGDAVRPPVREKALKGVNRGSGEGSSAVRVVRRARTIVPETGRTP
jgi:hypothetical protein